MTQIDKRNVSIKIYSITPHISLSSYPDIFNSRYINFYLIRIWKYEFCKKLKRFRILYLNRFHIIPHNSKDVYTQYQSRFTPRFTPRWAFTLLEIDSYNLKSFGLFAGVLLSFVFFLKLLVLIYFYLINMCICLFASSRGQPLEISLYNQL